MRFSPPGWKSGKSGALRVCYAHFEAYHIVLLVTAYPKAVKDDLAADERKAMKAILASIENAFSRGAYN